MTLQLHEPATLLTDVLLGTLAGGLAWRLHRQRPVASLAQQWWSRTLGLTAASALVGGGYHGFAPNFAAAVGDAWWVVTLWIILLISAAMAMSLLHEVAPKRVPRLWPWLIGLKLVGFAGIAVFRPEFVVAILDYGLAMLAWTAAALILRRSWSGWMLAAIALSIIAAAVQQLHWSLSPSFNHNDLFHLIQALAVIGFYRAGRLFSPGAAVTSAIPQ